MTDHHQDAPPHSSDDDHSPLALMLSRIADKQGAHLANVATRTKVVMRAKWSMAAIAGLLILILIIIPLSVPEEASIRLVFSNIAQGTAENPVMENPRYEGLNDKNQPYTVIAKQARERTQDLIDLDAIQADVAMGENEWVNLHARQGVYNRATRHLHLKGNVSLYFDQGYEMHSEESFVDMNTGIAKADVEVQGQGPTGTLRADRYQFDQTKKHAFFAGNVRVVLYLDGK